jgi:oxepin-CoA hydrolase/3-oxo-5,6-dehydrosuberyl-CoA semialdehyde dehydrogenase
MVSTIYGFLKPVSLGDSISVRLTVKQKSPARKPAYGEVRGDVEVFNQTGNLSLAAIV